MITKILSHSPSRRKEVMIRPPPSTSTEVMALRASSLRSPPRSTLPSFPSITRTSALSSRALIFPGSARWVVTMRVGAEESSTRALRGVFRWESSTTLRGFLPLTSLTVSWGSSASTVLIPTSTASFLALSRWARRRASSELIHRESPFWVAILPSMDWAHFRVTKGTPSSRHLK